MKKIQSIESKILADLMINCLMNYWGEKTLKFLFIYCYETVWDVWRSSTEKRRSTFFTFFTTINFQEISDVISTLRFLPVPDLSHKQQLDVSNQNRTSMALKISKHSFRKYIQFFISAPTEKRFLNVKWIKLEI